MTRANAGVLQRKLAWRFFSGGRSSALVSMISSISLAGMVIAVALLVLVLSVMNGFEREFRERILGLVPHATLWLDRDTDIAQELATLRSRPTIKHALPFIEFKALAIRGAVAEPVLVQGTDYARFRERATDFIRGGDAPIPAALEAGQLILGHGLATKLGLQVGEKLRLMVMDNPGQVLMGGALTPSVAAGQRTSVHTVTLVATLHTGSELDQRVALASLPTAAAISNNVAGFDGVQLQFNDVFAAPRLVAEIANAMPLLYRYSDWTRSYGNLYTAIQLSRQIVVLLLASIVAIAAFNIFVTLGMVVRHKRHDIAILRSMGYTRRSVLAVFIWQGMWVAAIGAACGLILGCALAVLAPPLVNAQQAFAQHALLSTEIYPIDYLPSEIRAGDLLLISVVALVMSFFATLIPAWQAAKLQPAGVLNGKGR